MIDHVSIGVSDLSRAMRFYEAVLGAIGYAALDVRGATVGFGKKYSEFWLNARPEMAPLPDRRSNRFRPSAARPRRHAETGRRRVRDARQGRRGR